MYVLLYVSYLYICNVIGANKTNLKKTKKQKKKTFTVYHRKDGESKITYSDGIADTGFGTKIIFKATGLEPNTLYFFRVQSKNMHGESNLLPEVPIETLGLNFLFLLIS